MRLHYGGAAVQQSLVHTYMPSPNFWWFSQNFENVDTNFEDLKFEEVYNQNRRYCRYYKLVCLSSTLW